MGCNCSSLDSDNGGSPLLLLLLCPGQAGHWTLTLHIRGDEECSPQPGAAAAFILGPGSGESRARSLGDNTCDSVIIDTGYSVIMDTEYSTVQCHLVTERTGGDQQICTLVGCAWLLSSRCLSLRYLAGLK